MIRAYVYSLNTGHTSALNPEPLKPQTISIWYTVVRYTTLSPSSPLPKWTALICLIISMLYIRPFFLSFATPVSDHKTSFALSYCQTPWPPLLLRFPTSHQTLHPKQHHILIMFNPLTSYDHLHNNHLPIITHYLRTHTYLELLSSSNVLLLSHGFTNPLHHAITFSWIKTLPISTCSPFALHPTAPLLPTYAQYFIFFEHTHLSTHAPKAFHPKLHILSPFWTTHHYLLTH